MRCTELETVSYNVDAILDRRAMETEKGSRSFSIT